MAIWFPVERQALSLDFGNTTYLRNGVHTDGLVAAGGVADWTRAIGVAPIPAAAGPALIELRDAIRTLFRATVDGVVPPGVARNVVNDAAKAAPGWLELDHDGATARTRRGVDPATNLRAQLATDAIALVTGPDRALLR